MKRILIYLFVVASFTAQAQKKEFFLLNANTAPNYGLVSDLMNQTGNSGAIQIRTVWNGIVSGGKYTGSYSAATSYSTLDIIGYPSDTAPMRYRANQSTSAGESPDTHPAKWDLQLGVEMIQDLGSGVYSRYSLGIRNAPWVRLNGLEVGTLSTSSFTRKESYYNTPFIGTATSTTSMNIPASHPSSRSLTVGTGLSIANSSTLSGTCTDNFAIPTTHPTLSARNLPSGLSLTTGDLVVMYGDANNFFGYVIARYDNTTGEAYGGSTFHVGSGTFSSWTLKSERLIYINRTADPAGKNLLALVQSYDSGTGALVFNTVNNVGNTTNSDWTVFLNGKQPPSIPGTNGTRYNGNLVNNPAGTYGLWHVVTWRGNTLQQKSTVANNGTGWVYVYGSGAETTPPSDVDIDTYNVSTTTAVRTTFSNLTLGTHTVIAFSKVSASGSSTNTRPYIDAGTTAPNHSFNENYNYDVFTPTVELGPRGAESFGEMAWKFRDTDGGDATYWVPEHINVITTSLSIDPIMVIDGTTVDMLDETNSYHLKFQSASSARLEQIVSVNHPQATGDMATLSSTHNFGRQGVDYSLNITWLQNGYIETGYNNMLFLGHAWFNKVQAQDGETATRPADNTSANLTSTMAGQASYLFYSTGSSPLSDYVIGQYWPTLSNWRTGLTASVPFMQDFSGSANAKWYPYVYVGHTVTAPEITTVKGRVFIGRKGTLTLN